MDKIFIIKLILSFVVGGSYIAFLIWISEKFGSRIGGMLIGLPSTGLISLIFIAWTQSKEVAVRALPVFPATIGAAALFIVAFIYFHKYGNVKSFLLALLLWFVLSFPLAFFALRNIWISFVLGIIFLGIAIWRLNKFPYKKLESFTLTRNEFLFRIIFAGSLIAFAVFLGKALGPLFGGMFASFPVAFSSSLLILKRRHGIEFTSSVARTMPYGGIGNVIFAMTFFFVVPLLGMFLGTTLACLTSVIFILILNNFILKK